MRPSLVLSLVLVAVGALIAALFLFDSGPGETTDQAATRVEQPAEPASRPNQQLQGGENIQPTERTAPTPVPAERSEREVLATGDEVFGSSIAGVVMDPEGQPLDEATVVLKRGGGPAGLVALHLLAGTGPPPAPSRSVRTDENGLFEVLDVEPGTDYIIVADHADFAPKEVAMVEVRKDEQTYEEIRLEAGYTVLGYVHDDGGQPVEGAELRLVDLLFAQLPSDDARVDAMTATTDIEGHYRFEHVAAGMRSLTVTKEGFGAQTANNLSVGGEVPTVARDFILQPGFAIAGQVVSPSRQPVANAKIRAISYDSGRNSSGFGTSDDDGNFHIPDLAEGSYSLVADAPGWGTARLNRIEAGDTGVLVEMIQQGTVMGRVLTESGSQPVSDFNVFVRVIIPNSTVYGRRAGKTEVRGSADGSYEIGGLDKGQYVVEAVAPGYAPSYSETFEIEQGLVTSDIVVRVSPGGLLRGRVLSGATGEPLEGARITTHDNIYVRHALIDVLGGAVPRTTTDRTAVTDANGEFELSNLWPDVYQIQVAHPDHMLLIRKDIRVNGGGAETNLGDIRLDVGGGVTGTVYDHTGQPLANATVSLSGNPQDPTAFYQARTDAQGRYTLRNAVPGQYRLHATRPYDQSNPFGAIIDMNTSQVTINVTNAGTVNQDLSIGE